jgi:transcriptional regulator with XRE-family HTH domain
MPRRTKNATVAAIENAIETHVAGRIRLRRGLLGLSQSDLARALGLTFQQVQKYERGSNRVSIGKLVRMAEILDVPLTFFFDGLEVPGVGEVQRSGNVPANDAASPLGRRDLDLLRAWRAAPADVADAVTSLLRSVSFGEAPAEAGDDAAESGEESSADRRRRRKRGAVWDPADVVSPKRRK